MSASLSSVESRRQHRESLSSVESSTVTVLEAPQSLSSVESSNVTVSGASSVRAPQCKTVIEDQWIGAVEKDNNDPSTIRSVSQRHTQQ